MMSKNEKIVITGAAGLVGQNLIMMLQEQGYTNIVAIDKNQNNLNVLAQLNPQIKVFLADLANAGDWREEFADTKTIIILHAQITGTQSEEFIANNVTATANVLDSIKKYRIPYIIHISSSVVNSVANDDYTKTKKDQENLVIQSGVNYCVLRPTLMFGWFDRKHLGWLSRLMERSPIFPVPGNGHYLRQPLYCKDFCRIIVLVLANQPQNQVFNIVGSQEIYYIDIIKTIKHEKKLKTVVLPIPYFLFYSFLKFVEFITPKPPFTAQQLTALTAGDYFVGDDVKDLFGIEMTDFKQAIHETFSQEKYSHIILER